MTFWAANPQFDSMLDSGLSNRDEKLGFIDRVMAPHSSEFFANYLRVLAQHDRLDLLKEILATARLEFENETVSSEFRLSVPGLLMRRLWHVSKNGLLQPLVLNQLLNLRRIRVSIGGIVIRVGNSVYDGSLRSWLKQLAKTIHQGSLHEIQSGRDRFSHPEGD